MLDLIVGALLGYLFGWFISGKKEGEPGLIHWEWSVRNTCIHLHHWLVFTILLIIYANLNVVIYPPVAGFLLGGIVHGLTYSDWYVFIS